MKAGASSVKSTMMSSFSKVQKQAEGLSAIDALVGKLEDTYISEEARKRELHVFDICVCVHVP